MLTFEVRVLMSHSGEQRIIKHANNRRNAVAMAEAQTGGKSRGGHELAGGHAIANWLKVTGECCSGVV